VNSGSILVRSGSTGQQLAGSFKVNGAVVTFTPAVPWPASTSISHQVDFNSNVLDLAGNTANFFSTSFTTGAQ
jgi:hypothetical protein